MLSPNINTVNGFLTESLNNIIKLDNYSKTTTNLLIGKLSKDPNWLVTVRNRISLLSDAGISWIDNKPAIWSEILVQFSDYASAFAGITAIHKKGTISKDNWINLLNNVLYGQLSENIKKTTVANQKLIDEQNKFKNIQPLLDESIREGWSALASEEQQMIKIAEELIFLQDTVASLESSITAGIISDNKSVITSSVTTMYKLVSVGGTASSFLSMATSVITVGKMFYDIIADTKKINETLDKIAELQTEASEEAQAAAGTKMVLQLLYNLEKSFGAIQNVIPLIITMWDNERNKVKSLINALDSGANPDSNFEIYTIPTANSNWQAMSVFASNAASLNYTTGKPVILEPEKVKILSI